MKLYYSINILFFLGLFSPAVIAKCDQSSSDEKCEAMPDDNLPFPENGRIEDQLDWLENRREYLADMCSYSKCCSEAEDKSLHMYTSHSLAIENITFDEDENALLKTSSYVDNNLKLEEISMSKILAIHKMILKGTGGNLRTTDVAVQNPVTKEIYPTPSHKSVEENMSKFIKWILEESNDLHPIQAAILIKLNFVKIHPFPDGNGRFSRLLFNWMLRKDGGVGWITFFSEDIEQYYEAVTEASLKRNFNPFLEYIMKSMVKSYQFFLHDLKNCS